MKKRRRNSPGNIIATLVTLTVLLMLAWQFLPPATLQPLKSPTAVYTKVVPPTETPKLPNTFTFTPRPPTATGTPTLHIPFFGSITVTSSPTLTPSITPTKFVSKHQLDVPIGTDRKFIIHRLEEGESLDPHVLEYNTSIEAVLAINYYLYLTNPVKRDVLIVFPLNFADVSGLHVLTIYQMPESIHGVNPNLKVLNFRGINYEDLVLYLRNHINLEDFKYYNGITEPGDRPLVGDYFLIPQKRLVP